MKLYKIIQPAKEEYGSVEVWEYGNEIGQRLWPPKPWRRRVIDTVNRQPSSVLRQPNNLILDKFFPDEKYHAVVLLPVVFVFLQTP
jgi:hypothetical protein